MSTLGNARSTAVRRTAGVPAALLVLAGLAGGCASDADGRATTARGTAEEPTASTPTSGAPTRRVDLSREGRAARGTELVFTGIRVTARDGVGRVVLRMRGSGAPGWFVKPGRTARQEGSGRLIRLDGDSVVDVHASGTVWPAQGYYDGPRRITPRGAGPVAEVYVGGTFEGWTQVVVGVEGDPRPVEVKALRQPPRLVVEIPDRG